MQNNLYFDHIIVGGGIIGLMTARELCLYGQSVAVIERNALGQESSSAGGGILSPLYPWREPEPIHALARYGQKVYPELSEELKSTTAIDPECIHSGYIVLDASEYDQAYQCAKKYHYPLESISQKEIIKHIPGIDINYDVLIFPEVHQIRPPKLIEALKQWLIQHDVALFEQTPVSSVLIENEKVKGVSTSERKIFSDHVIVTTGAWTRLFLQQHNHSISIEPVKGQMITYSIPVGLIKNIIIQEDRYLIPRQDGELVVGSTVEFVGFDKEITEQAMQELKNAAEKILPDLKSCSIQKQWSGLRPGIQSGIPIISASNIIENLYISSGHYRNGILMAPASAKLLADLINQKPLSFEINPQLYLLK